MGFLQESRCGIGTSGSSAIGGFCEVAGLSKRFSAMWESYRKWWCRWGWDRSMPMRCSSRSALKKDCRWKHFRLVVGTGSTFR